MMTRNEKAMTKKNATDYVLYMIASSYFKKAVCTTKVLEKRLFLYYKDLSVKEQEQIEERCIRYVEKQLMNEVPQNIWDESVTVAMKTDSSDRVVITFTGSHWNLKICSDNLKKPNIEGHAK